jgi:DNA-directed RNA polymerase specialized sigma subunit
MLSKEETERLLCRAKEGCKEAKERLIAENSPLIKSAIRRYRGRGVEYEDLY